MRKANITLAFIGILILVGFGILVAKSGVAAQKSKINFSTPRLQSTEDKLKALNIQYEKLNVELKSKSSSDKETIEKLKIQEQENQAEQQKLKEQLQAKADAKAKLEIAAAEAANRLTATSTAHAQSYSYALPAGSHTDWMAAAGIDPANYGYVDYIVSHESGWNPCSYNPGQSNCNMTAEQIGYHACGLGQQLPCGKWAGAWNDPIAALVAMNIYVGKFGGWAGAYSYWIAHGNY